MMRKFFHAKIHRASVTAVELDYEGSLTIDPVLLEASGIMVHEQIHVLNINNGERFVTYAIEGERGSGVIQVNGAAAHLCHTGDLLIILTYADLEASEIASHAPTVVYVDASNSITSVSTHAPVSTH